MDKRYFSKFQMPGSTFSLWLVLFVIFLDNVGIGLVYPMFSSMIFEPGSTFIDAAASNMMKGWYFGIMLAAMPLANFFSGPILGTLSDQKGRRPLFLFCLSLAVVGYFCSIIGVVTKSLITLIISRIIVGLADGSMGVVSAAIADLSLDEQSKTKNFGLYGMVSGIGFAIGPLVGGLLSTFGFIFPFLAAGLATLLNLLFIWLFFPETNKFQKSAAIDFTAGIRNLKRAFQIQNFRTLFLTCIFFCIGWSFFYEFLPVILISDYGFDKIMIGFFFAFGSFWYALSSGVLIRPIIKYFKPNPVLFCSLWLLGFSIFVFLLHPNTFLLWLFVIIVNFLIALVYPNYITIISNLAGPETQGEILGISGSLQALAFAIGPVAAGFLVGKDNHMPMLIGGISMLFAAVIGGIYLSKNRVKIDERS